MIDNRDLSLYIMDGTYEGCLNLKFDGFYLVAYKIPREDFSKLKNGPKEEDLTNSSIYLLFGNKDGNPTVYVGQASARKNGNAALQRIPEPHSTQDWDTAIILTTKKDDEFGRSELCYLENLFYKMAKEAGSFAVVNNVEPPTDKSIKEKEKRRLGKYVDHVQFIVKLLGYNVFEKVVTSTKAVPKEKIIPASIDVTTQFYCKTRGAEAIGRRTEDDGFIVLKGSILSTLPPTNSCPEATLKRREDNKDIIRNGVTLKDISFSSPSAASSFVILSNTNGNNEWRTKDGIKLTSFRNAKETIESKKIVASKPTNTEFYCTDRGASAIGYQTDDGFVVKKDSLLTLMAPTASCPESAKKALEGAKAIIKDNRLTEDIAFKSASAASNFVLQATTNGRKIWHTKDGISLGEASIGFKA